MADVPPVVIVAGEAVEDPAEATVACPVARAAAVTIEGVEEIVEHGNNPFRMAAGKQKNPGRIRMDEARV